MQTGMLQIQLLVPSMNVDASLTTNMKRGDDLELELRSDIHVMNVISMQKIAMKYGNVILPFALFSDDYVMLAHL